MRSTHPWMIAVAVAFLATAFACSDEERGPVGGGDAGSGGLPGTGGVGGSGGTGGTAGAGGDGGTGGIPKTDWEGVGFGLDARYQGFAEVGSLAIADFVGDGTLQIAIGGRRPLLLSGDGTRQLWFSDWETDENLLRGGDNDWVYELAAIPAEADRSNLLVTSSLGDARLLDGRDGSTIWSILPDMRHGFPFFTRFDTAADLAFFPYTGRAAYSATTGAELWRLPVPMVPVFLQPADQGGAVQGLFLVDEGDQLVGGGLQSRPGALASVSSEGALEFFVELPPGDQPLAVGAADLDADGVDEAILAIFGKPMQAWNADGAPRWDRDMVLYGEDPLRTKISQIIGHDLDGDGVDEILVIASDSWAASLEQIPGMVVALEADGTERWRFQFVGSVTEAQLVQWAGEPVLLLATGLPDLGTPGTATAVRLAGDIAERTLFRYEMPRNINTIGIMEEAGDRTLVLATGDGVLRTIGDDGNAGWTHYLTSFFQETATVDVGGEDWILSGDLHGSIALLDAGLERRWYRRMNVGTFGWVTAVTAGRIDSTGELRLIAGAKANRDGSMGVVETFGLDGARLPSTVLPSEPLAVAAVDIDADGVEEIVVLEGMRAIEESCHLRAYDGSFALLWERPVARCQYGQLSVAEMDEDGADTIAVRTHPGILGGPTTLSIVTLDGTLRWKIEEELQLSMWIHAVPGGILAGGATTGRNGFVARYGAAAGAELWRTLLPPRTHPNMPEGDPLPGASWYGNVVRRAGGFDVAVTSYHNQALLLDGGTGAIAWSVMTETEENFTSQRHAGGPIVFVPGTATTPPHLVTGQHDESRRRSELLTLTMEGEIVGRVPMASPAWRIHLARRGDAPAAAVVQTLLGIYAASVKPMP